MGAPHRQGRRSSPSCRSNLRRGGGAERSPIAHCSGASQHALPHTSSWADTNLEQQEVHPLLRIRQQSRLATTGHTQLVCSTTARWTSTRLPACLTCSCMSAPAPRGCRGGQRTRGAGGRPHSGSWSTWRARTSGSAQGACGGKGAVARVGVVARGAPGVLLDKQTAHPACLPNMNHTKSPHRGRMTAHPQQAARPQPMDQVAHQAVPASTPHSQPGRPNQPTVKRHSAPASVESSTCWSSRLNRKQSRPCGVGRGGQAFLC